MASKKNALRVGGGNDVNEHPLHVHSIVVHAVVGLAPVAAAAFILAATGVSLGSLGPDVWAFLLRGSVAAMLVIAVPSTLTGISERDHMYANWHRTHRVKLWLSLVLLGLTGFECVVLWRVTDPVPLATAVGVAVVVGNPLVVFLLSFFGLKITLGRQAFAGTSYLPDMRRTPPVDILQVVASWQDEDAKLVDVLGEGDA